MTVGVQHGVVAALSQMFPVTFYPFPIAPVERHCVSFHPLFLFLFRIVPFLLYSTVALDNVVQVMSLNFVDTGVLWRFMSRYQFIYSSVCVDASFANGLS